MVPAPLVTDEPMMKLLPVESSSPRIWMVPPDTVVLSRPSTTPVSITRRPLRAIFRLALLMLLAPATLIVPVSVMVPPVTVVPFSVRVLPPSTVSW